MKHTYQGLLALTDAQIEGMTEEEVEEARHNLQALRDALYPVAMKLKAVHGKRVGARHLDRKIEKFPAGQRQALAALLSSKEGMARLQQMLKTAQPARRIEARGAKGVGRGAAPRVQEKPE